MWLPSHQIKVEKTDVSKKAKLNAICKANGNRTNQTKPRSSIMLPWKISQEIFLGKVDSIPEEAYYFKEKSSNYYRKKISNKTFQVLGDRRKLILKAI